MERKFENLDWILLAALIAVFVPLSLWGGSERWAGDTDALPIIMFIVGGAYVIFESVRLASPPIGAVLGALVPVVTVVPSFFLYHPRSDDRVAFTASIIIGFCFGLSASMISHFAKRKPTSHRVAAYTKSIQEHEHVGLGPPPRDPCRSAQRDFRMHPLHEDEASSVEAQIRTYLDENDRVGAMGECMRRLKCDYDAADAIVRLIQNSPCRSQEIRDVMQKAAMGQAIGLCLPPVSPTQTNSALGEDITNSLQPNSDSSVSSPKKHRTRRIIIGASGVLCLVFLLALAFGWFTGGTDGARRVKVTGRVTLGWGVWENLGTRHTVYLEGNDGRSYWLKSGTPSALGILTLCLEEEVTVDGLLFEPAKHKWRVLGSSEDFAMTEDFNFSDFILYVEDVSLPDELLVTKLDAFLGMSDGVPAAIALVRGNDFALRHVIDMLADPSKARNAQDTLRKITGETYKTAEEWEKWWRGNGPSTGGHNR